MLLYGWVSTLAAQGFTVCTPISCRQPTECLHSKSDELCTNGTCHRSSQQQLRQKTSSQCALCPTIFILVCINNVSSCGAQLKSDTPCAPKANAIINLYTTAVSTGLPITPNKGLYTLPRLHSPLQPVTRSQKKKKK